ncbi:MAG: bifunctional diaminohydroxyphosphoribosylaminopyrimidine deaminase/5-amino-6-(5-phosphoribosylamino)uracil reductase RibD [Chloroflexi bacterium]|nr:bifunctional diaminohydroxyphosphoribosylaminopyrimidine deaminase/5-amino-6-(5-phosphoribosylamino)uracil reductase RibD [Chloroflexota bacterium]
MALALALAQEAVGWASPNPAVGAVIVKGGVVVGRGTTQPPGSAHAEVVALREAGEAARGTTMYVSLEPCRHYGRTPPCTTAIIQAGVAEVHMATLDPNPLVAGQGKRELEAAGIVTHLGERQAEARRINEAYAKYITNGRPFVTAKFAVSLDGRIATRTRESKWITGEASRDYSQRLRRQVDAIMVGLNTVLADDPQLTVRDGGSHRRQPLRVVVDSRGRLPPTARLLREPGHTLVAVAGSLAASQLETLRGAGAEVLVMPDKEGLVDVAALVTTLGRREVTHVLVEGGGTLLGSFFDAGLVDRVAAFLSPMIIGGSQAMSPVLGQGVAKIAEAPRLRDVAMERLGDDFLITGYLAPTPWSI